VAEFWNPTGHRRTGLRPRRPTVITSGPGRQGRHGLAPIVHLLVSAAGPMRILYHRRVDTMIIKVHALGGPWGGQAAGTLAWCS
jgi:hypothetical protein